jgi:hypothetical protein
VKLTREQAVAVATDMISDPNPAPVAKETTAGAVTFSFATTIVEMNAENARLRRERDGARAVSREFTDEYNAVVAELAALRAEIDAALVVYASAFYGPDAVWDANRDRSDSHRARLVRIEPIPGK